MDGVRFDQLVRDVLGGASRRGLLHLLGALPVVGGLASIVDEAEAKKGKGKGKNDNKDNDVAGEKNKAKRRKKQCKKRKKQACADQCGIVTVKCKLGNKRNAKNKNKQVDCGPCVCEPACEVTECCDQGTCVVTCPAGQVCIDGSCGTPACTVCDDGCPFTSVQEAIDDPDSGDTITICAGAFGGNISINRNLTIIGAGDDATSLEGDGNGSVVSIANDLTVEIQDVTITGGINDGGVGGGIANGTAQTTLIGVHVTGNIAGSRGGGIDINAGGLVTLNNSRVTGNSAGTDGGGVLALGDLVLVNESVVADNEAGENGGGIAIQGGGTVTIDPTSSVTDNSAVDDGGGVYNEGEITCEAAVVTGNTAGDPMPVTSNCIDDGGSGCDDCNAAP